MADREECTGYDFEIKPYLQGAEECAFACKGVASMFIFGTNDFGTNRCSTSNRSKCKCWCQKGASADGSCSAHNHNGYKLYKYT